MDERVKVVPLGPVSDNDLEVIHFGGDGALQDVPVLEDQTHLGFGERSQNDVLVVPAQRQGR